MKIQIQPVQVFPETATQLELTGAKIRRLSSEGDAHLFWRLLSADNKILTTGVVSISNSEYQEWQDDDPYLMDLALQKLGLTSM